MRVRVRPINLRGQPLRKDERLEREVYEGRLALQEVRINDFGRALTRARVTDLLEGNEKVMLELLDAVVIWIGEQSMRIRGFETVAGVQYGQTWDVEIV